MRPSEWNDDDKAAAKEQSRLGAIAAVEEIHTRLSRMILSKIWQIILGWALIESAKIIIQHQGFLKG